MTEFLNVPRGQIAYQQTGRGPAGGVRARPGRPARRLSDRFLTPQLIQAGYRVTTMDLRGHGESSTYWDCYSPSQRGRRHHRADPASRRPSRGDRPFLLHWVGGRRRRPGPTDVLGIVLIAPFASPPK